MIFELAIVFLKICYSCYICYFFYKFLQAVSFKLFFLKLRKTVASKFFRQSAHKVHKVFPGVKIVGTVQRGANRKNGQGWGRGWETLCFSSSLFFPALWLFAALHCLHQRFKNRGQKHLANLFGCLSGGRGWEGPIVLKEHKQKPFALDNVQTSAVLVPRFQLKITFQKKIQINCVYILLKACFVKT